MPPDTMHGGGDSITSVALSPKMHNLNRETSDTEGHSRKQLLRNLQK